MRHFRLQLRKSFLWQWHEFIPCHTLCFVFQPFQRMSNVIFSGSQIYFSRVMVECDMMTSGELLWLSMINDIKLSSFYPLGSFSPYSDTFHHTITPQFSARILKSNFYISLISDSRIGYDIINRILCRCTMDKIQNCVGNDLKES